MVTKTYIGDGVYAEFEPNDFSPRLILTTEDGISVDNRIVLEGREWALLCEFVKNWTER